MSNSYERLKDFGEKQMLEKGMPSYYWNAFMDFTNKSDFTDKKILEIGGSSIPDFFIFDILGAKNWTSVDLISHPAGLYQSKNNSDHYNVVTVCNAEDFLNLPKLRYEIFNSAIEDIPDSRDNFYDIGISINAFEHIVNFDSCLSKIYRLLGDGGVLHSQFGPIWSSFRGSHFWVDGFSNFMDSNFIPPWAHLLMSEEELKNYLLRINIKPEYVQQIVFQFYHSNFINRKFYDDYVYSLSNSKFSSYETKGLWHWECPKKFKTMLIQCHGDKNFNDIGMNIYAKK
jgi:hypothetical protein